MFLNDFYLVKTGAFWHIGGDGCGGGGGGYDDYDDDDDDDD